MLSCAATKRWTFRGMTSPGAGSRPGYRKAQIWSEKPGRLHPRRCTRTCSMSSSTACNGPAGRLRPWADRTGSRESARSPDASSSLVPPLRYPSIAAGAALSVAPARSKPGARSVSYEWHGNNCGSGTLSVHFPHDGNAHRIRALFHRPAGSGRPASGAPGAWRRRGSHLHQSRPHRHDPRPPRPSSPCAKATPWSSRNSTGRAGPSWMRAPSPISFGNEA